MKKIGWLSLQLLILILGNFALAKGSIVIEGADSKNIKVLRSLIEDNLEDPENLNDLQRVIGLIYQTGQYNDVEVYFDDKGDHRDTIFKVFPLRIIRKTQVAGNSSFSSSDILNELGISDGEGYSPEKVRTGVESIKRFYNLKGYLNAAITGEFVKIEGSPDLVLVILVHEGDPCLIEDVTFKSVNGTLNRQLQSHFKEKSNQVFSQNLLTSLQNEVGEELFKEKYYSATVLAPETAYNPLKTRVSLTYVINDPYAFAITYEITHEGSTGLDQSQIEKDLDLSPTNRLSTSPIDDLMERILRVYKKRGYSSVSVKYRESLFTQEYERRVNFIVKEGPRVKVKDIVFEGSYSRGPKYYKNFVLDHSSDLVSGKIYNSDDIDTGIKNLLIELQNQGFISAKVTGTRTDFDKKKENVVIRVTLDEGPQTFVQQIAFKGVRRLTKAEVENAIGLKAGGPLNLGTLEAASSSIEAYYQSKGYLDAQVTNQGKSIISYSADNTKATLTFEINEGPQVIVSSIVIEGNTFTKEYVIRRELQFHPGDVLTPDKIAYTEQKLQRLSLFGSVEIHTLEEDATQGDRTVLVHVQERDPGVFKIGGGINNELGFTMKAFTGFAYRNLWGTGRGINARAEIADKTAYNLFVENTVNVGYTEPFVFGTENTGRVNLIESRKIISVTNPFVFAQQTLQGDTVLERDLTQRLKLLFEVYGLAQQQTWEITGATSAPPQNLIHIATTGPSFLYDRRDDPFNPTFGDLSSLSLEYSSPDMGSSSTVNYAKGEASYTRYTPMGRVVWANSAKGGYIRNLSSDPNSLVPSVKAFFLGGPSTIRGFNPAEAFPSPKEYPLGPNRQGQPPDNGTSPYYGLLFDSFYMLAKTEIRFPIYKDLGGAFFYDGGKVGIPGYNPQFVWRDSVGIGLRYNTPVGPASLEYARKLERDETRPTGPESYDALIISIGVF